MYKTRDHATISTSIISAKQSKSIMLGWQGRDQISFGCDSQGNKVINLNDKIQVKKIMCKHNNQTLSFALNNAIQLENRPFYCQNGYFM